MSCISDSFLDGCSKLQIVSCYETSKMDLINCLVSSQAPTDDPLFPRESSICLGRHSKCTHRGIASDRTETLLRYAARNWVSYFHQTDRDGGNPNLAYHQNLCHPLFPGFVTWTPAYWYPDVSVISAGEGDDGHDACLRFLDLLDEDFGSDQYTVAVLTTMTTMTQKTSRECRACRKRSR